MEKLHKVLKAIDGIPNGITRQAGVSDEDYGNWAIATTEEVDIMGDIVRVEGVSWSDYHQPERGINLKILANHARSTPDGSPTIIGRVEEFVKSEIATKDGTAPAVLMRWTWAKDEEGNIADLASRWKQLYPKYVNQFSVGMFPLETDTLKSTGGYDLKKVSLFEVSLVTTPANPSANALKEMRKALGEAEFDRLELPIKTDSNEDLKKYIDEKITQEVYKMSKYIGDKLDDVIKAVPSVEKLEKSLLSFGEHLDLLQSVIVSRSLVPHSTSDNRNKSGNAASNDDVVKAIRDATKFIRG